MDYKNSKWAIEILEQQRADGSWGNFHSLSITPGQKYCTETALRRLRMLGFTIEDEPIKKAVDHMHYCLDGHAEEYGTREKVTHDFDMFSGIMFSAWIRLFTMEDKLANANAKKWAKVISDAFRAGEYDNSAYIKSYTDMFGLKPHGGRLEDFSCFYQVTMLAGALSEDIEEAFFRYIINYEKGIYYIAPKAIINPPQFEGSAWYLYVIELLCRYKNPNCIKMLSFVKEWIMKHKGEDGMWDMGKKAKDMICYPLSEDWRTDEKRKKDCTYMINRVLTLLE